MSLTSSGMHIHIRLQWPPYEEVALVQSTSKYRKYVEKVGRYGLILTEASRMKTYASVYV